MQTKYYVVPQMKDVLRPCEASIRKLETSLKNLGLDYIDNYLLHGPIHVQSIKTIAKSIADRVDKGMTKSIDVANYSLEDMITMQEEMANYGIPLAITQVQFSVLRCPLELSGLLQACEERGIVIQSYSSLAQGRLTGKYTSAYPPPKQYRFSSYDVKDMEPVNALL